MRGGYSNVVRGIKMKNSFPLALQVQLGPRKLQDICQNVLCGESHVLSFMGGHKGPLWTWTSVWSSKRWAKNFPPCLQGRPQSSKALPWPLSTHIDGTTCTKKPKRARGACQAWMALEDKILNSPWQYKKKQSTLATCMVLNTEQ